MFCFRKGIGVIMNADVKVSAQCRIAARKVIQMLGLISRNVAHKEKLTNNTTQGPIKSTIGPTIDQIEIVKILSDYENIDTHYCFQLRTIEGLKDMM